MPGGNISASDACPAVRCDHVGPPPRPEGGPVAVTEESTPKTIEDHPLVTTPPVVPPDLEARAAERGWPEGLVARALELRVPRGDIDIWLGDPRMTAPEVTRLLATHARVFDGPLRAREATWRDGEALADLYANAPETVGDWRLVVERAPNPYAQFRLQEHPNLQVVECRGVLLAAAAHACRNTYIAGERFAVHFMSAWRVRDEFRGYGLSRVLQGTAGPGTAWFGPITYWYERVGNASQGWLDMMRTMAESRDNKVDGLSATVHLFVPPSNGPSDVSGLRARAAVSDDLPRCVELINRTHSGLDLFRPYSLEFLEGHLDDPSWGPTPDFIPSVYGWPDFEVVEDGDGSVVACGGLWDRGRDVREVWSNSATGEQRTVAATALLDWGYDPARVDGMSFLLRRFLSRTAELGRGYLLAPLEHEPELLEELADLDPAAETRALRCMGFNDGTLRVESQLTRPYTDLAYW